MRIAVIGAGIVGVTTAYELAHDGHAVTVFERRPGVAAETSFANAGVVAPGYVTPWSAPGMAWKVTRGLFSRHAAVRFGSGTLAATPWLWRFLRASRRAVYQRNRAQMQRLAQYSRERMQVLCADLKLDYEQHQGYTVLLRSAQDLRAVQAGLAVLAELGVEHDVIDAATCRRLEPALHPETALHAAIHLPRDGVGNCRQFAHLMKAHAAAVGARFAFGQTVQALRVGDGVDVVAGGGQARFDAVVVCAGHQSGSLLAPLKLKLPLLPVCGYSLTAPIRHLDGLPDAGPRSGLMDERYKVAISRLGQRVRVAGSAEIGGRLDHLHKGSLQTLYKVLQDWFPAAADLGRVQHWKGARPMLPDGPPVVGASGRPGLWLNLGHGSSGWALACGSARLLADQMAGRTPALAPEAFSIDRLRQ